MDVLAEKILLELKNAFKKDPLIDEFDILPVEESLSNKCPVLHVDHKVALEKWCVKHVYVYAYTKFLSWRKGEKSSEVLDPESLLSWTSALLLISPVLETAWNARKKMILQNTLLPCDELKFTEIVLSSKPKCSSVYAHRQWVLQKCDAIISLEREFTLCNRWADRYPCNYYAWGHRLWVLKNLGHNKQQIILDELTRTECWVSVHISDHCGLHYRQRLISALSLAKPVLKKEVDFCTELQKSFPGHEALWNHRRFLLWAGSSYSDRKNFDSDLFAKNFSESNQIPRYDSDKIQMRLKNITYTHYNNEVKSSDENGHSEQNPLDYNRVYNVPSEMDQRSANFKCESNTFEKKDPIEKMEHLYCNGLVSSSFVDEEDVKQEVEFVLERQNAACHWPWESLLIQRHVKWLSGVLGWRLLLNR